MESETRCPRCGAAHEPQQEYCLDCGARLPAGGGGGRRRTWARPALFFLAVSGVATGIAVAIGAIHSSSGTAAGTISVVVSTTAVTTTATTATTPPPPKPKPKPKPTPKPRPSGGLTTWPAGTNGYTVVLESIPSSSGAALPLAAARHAQRSGLPQVGVLASSSYASLHPGYSVVFSGVYPTSAAASAALPNAHARGFPSAYQARVAAG
jgi:hypothetical protein